MASSPSAKPPNSSSSANSSRDRRCLRLVFRVWKERKKDAWLFVQLCAFALRDSQTSHMENTCARRQPAGVQNSGTRWCDWCGPESLA